MGGEQANGGGRIDAPSSGDVAAVDLLSLAAACEEAARDPEVRHYFSASDFEVMAKRMRLAAAREERTRELLRRALGVIRDVERAGVGRALLEIDAEMGHAG